MNKSYDILPFSKHNNVPIVLACDNNYVPFTSVLLTSLVCNSSKKYNYDILLFQKDISEEGKMTLNNCLMGKDNISLRFIDVSAQIANLKLRVFSYYSEAIYYRLFAPWILNNYGKILYFDCDLVFNDDVAKLFSVDMKENLLGAIRDLGMILHKNNPYDSFPREYFSEYLENIDVNNYFNSGVLLMNLEQFRSDFQKDEIASFIGAKQWRFPDQDVLNVLCNKKTIILDSRWNTMPETLGGRTVENIKKYIKPEYYEDYLTARRTPGVIHYAMREKPWKYSIDLDWELGQYFWKYAFKSLSKIKVLKEKYKTCSFGELYELISMFDKKGINYQIEGRNIIAYYESFKMASLFKQPVLFELVNWTKDNLEIMGKFILSDIEKEMYSSLVFASDDNTFPVNYINVKETKKFGEKTLAREYHFSIIIPFKAIKKKNVFNFVYVVNGVEVRNGRFDFGKFFPVDRVLDQQYFVKNKVVMQVETGRMILTPLKQFNVRVQERKYREQIKEKYKENYRKIVIKREIYRFVKKIYKKDIWIISDRTYQAGDNGEALYDYVRDKRIKGIKAFYAISNQSEDYKRLKRKKGVLAVESNRFKLIRLLCDKMISSHCEETICYPYRQPVADLLVNQSVVFLQHGITKDDISSVYNKVSKNLSLFITASSIEQNSIISNPDYYLSANEVKLTGFPRFDKLKNETQKIISIVPTWRKNYLEKVDDFHWNIACEFEKTAYYSYYNNLLDSEKLNNFLKQTGYRIQFVQHPLMASCNNYFHDTETVSIVSDANYSQLFSQSALLVTDYSSTVFDFAYLRKPILYYQFDKEEFFTSHTYSAGYYSYERNGFGEICLGTDDLIDKIIDYINDGCRLKPEYRKRIDAFFAFDDKNNCQRVVDAIKSLNK